MSEKGITKKIGNKPYKSEMIGLQWENQICFNHHFIRGTFLLLPFIYIMVTSSIWKSIIYFQYITWFLVLGFRKEKQKPINELQPSWSTSTPWVAPIITVEPPHHRPCSSSSSIRFSHLLNHLFFFCWKVIDDGWRISYQ